MPKDFHNNLYRQTFFVRDSKCNYTSATLSLDGIALLPYLEMKEGYQLYLAKATNVTAHRHVEERTRCVSSPKRLLHNLYYNSGTTTPTPQHQLTHDTQPSLFQSCREKINKTSNWRMSPS